MARVSALLGLVLGLLMGGTPASAVELPVGISVAAYAYDLPHSAVVDEHRPLDTSLQMEASAASATYTYDGTTRLVQVAFGTDAGTEVGAVSRAELSSFQAGSVAAKTAAKACSFAGATVVLMADGSKEPIKDIEVGDKVIATDPETDEQEAKPVTQVFRHEDTVTDLLVDGEVITTTEDHPFWSVTDQRFDRADELEQGEQVLGADGRVLAVSGLDLGSARTALAYNLSVQGIHTYHVGDDEVLVHNTCPILPTRHSVNQKVNREVTSADELDAYRNPLLVRDVVYDQLGRPSQRYVGRGAEVVLNPLTNRIVSVNPTSTSKLQRLLRQYGLD